MKKVFQRRFYDILSSRNGLLVLLFLTGLTLTSAFFFGEVLMTWASSQYSNLLFSFKDNIVDKSMKSRLCALTPIDVVYTWVNGSDPRLLAQLNELKRVMQETRSPIILKGKEKTCPYAACVPLYSAFIKPPVSTHTFNKLKQLLNISQILDINGANNTRLNGTIVSLITDPHDFFHGKSLISVSLEGKDYRVSQIFSTYDSTSNGILSDRQLFLRDISRDLAKRDNAFFSQPHVLGSWNASLDLVHLTGNSLFLSFKTGNQKKEFENTFNTSVLGNVVKTHAYMVWDFEDDNFAVDMALSRFQDNEELRYSLRSVEMYAPWVHRIFIVTNGQVPYWLNTDHPRIQLVTHEEMFANSSHLPTFSSPAIESHLHRVPGLSRYFIYMNDDVFFGKPVYPDDFLTKAGEYKVYLSWPVPNCREGCPNNWLSDGYCDKACNYTECDWDAGDCLRSGGQAGWAGAPGVQGSLLMLQGGGVRGPAPAHSFCHTGCADNWLADRYCDQPCNVADCAFDAGDCGDTRLSQLTHLEVSPNQTMYSFAPDVTIVYLNMKAVIGEHGEITSGEFEQHPAVRTISLALKYKKLFVLLHQNVTRQPFNISVLMTGVNENKGNVTLHLTLLFNDVSAQPVLHQLPVTSPVPTSAPIIVFPSFTGYGDVKRYPQPTFNFSDPQFDRGGKQMVNAQVIRITGRPRKATLEDMRLGFMPWERNSISANRTKFPPNPARTRLPLNPTMRHLLDTFAESLRRTNRLITKFYGHTQRKVPGHMPHFIDRHVLDAANLKFFDAWSETSAHKIRSANDVQFSFAYFYYLMSERRNKTLTEIFRDLDTDHSGELNGAEIRTLLIHLYDLPFSNEKKLQFTGELSSNCSTLLSQTRGMDVLYNVSLSLEHVQACDSLKELITRAFPAVEKFPHIVMGEEELWFKMIGSNASRVRSHLDEVIKMPKKFLCLNDNLHHDDEQSLIVKGMMKEFLQNLYPHPSRFELPPENSNHFLYIDDLRSWKRTRIVRLWTASSLLILLVLAVLACIYRTKFRACLYWCLCRSRKCRRLRQVFDV